MVSKEINKKPIKWRVNDELRMRIEKEGLEPLTEGLQAKISCP